MANEIVGTLDYVSPLLTPANLYSLITERMVAELQGGLPLYTGLLVRRMVYHPATMPDFTRYAIIVAPPGRPWTERRVSTALVQYSFGVDVYVFVKRFDEEQSVWGVSPPNLGLFQLVDDVKTYLRYTDLSGVLDKTYDEPGGPLEFDAVATAGYDSAEYAFVHRAKIPYVCRVRPFCHPRMT